MTLPFDGARAEKWEAAARSAHSRVEFLEAEVERLSEEIAVAMARVATVEKERDEALLSADRWKKLAANTEAVRAQTYGYALTERTKVDSLRNQLGETIIAVTELRKVLAALVTAVECVQNAEFHNGGREDHATYEAQEALLTVLRLARTTLAVRADLSPEANR